MLTRRRMRLRHGYAMALMLVVLMVVTTITVTVVSTAVRDQESSRTTAARAEARLLGLAALEEFAGRIIDDPLLPARAATATAQTVHPALRTTGTGAVWARLPMPAARLPEGGVPGTAVGMDACPAVDASPGPTGYDYDCYYLEISDVVGPAANPVAFTVTATVRVRCAGVESRCVYASFQQRLRAAQFYDFVLAQELATLAPEALFPSGSWERLPDGNRGPNTDVYDRYRSACGATALERVDVSFTPSLINVSGEVDASEATFTPDGSSTGIDGCVDIAYQSDRDGADSVQGPLYTADDYVTVCGTPTLGDVFVSGPGYLDGAVRRPYRRGSAPLCRSGTPTLGAASRVASPYLIQPTSEFVVTEALARTDSPVVRLAKADADQPIELRFDDSGDFSVEGSDNDGDESYGGTIIVVEGDDRWGSVDVLVSGTVSGLVSLVVDGSVVIDGDLVYASSVGCNHVSTCLRQNQQDALSLTATERIEIWQTCGAASSQSCLPGNPSIATDRTVHGVLTSPQGYVGVPDWQTNTDGERKQGTLRFYGAVASRFQGVYGSYVADATGLTLLSGFYKSFVHDDRLTRYSRQDGGDTGELLAGLPPYVVASRLPVWVRLDVAEVGASSP